MEQLEKLLQAVQQYVIADKQVKEERQKRGEEFNIFSVLGVERHETNTHSAFIAELLNPEGSHGCGGKFLSAFINMFIKNIFGEQEINSARVIAEYYIGNKNEKETEGGRIDIAIYIGNQLFIIENKIDAKDQTNQLLRYKNRAEQEVKDYKILYLTLNGKDASELSTNNQLKVNVDYFPISYSKDILSWIIECEKIAFDKPRVREVLIQYAQTIRIITNQDMDKEEQNKMYEAMMQYPDAAAKMVRINFDDFRNFVFEKRCVPLFKKECEKRDLKFQEEKGRIDSDDKIYLSFWRENWKKYRIYLIAGAKETKVTNCSINLGSYYPTKELEEISSQMFSESGIKPSNTNIHWPLGFNPLEKYKDIESNDIISAFVDESENGYCAYIMSLIDKILSDISVSHICVM